MSNHLSDKILEASDGGLGIFKKLFPLVDWLKIESSNFRDHFKVRDEGTPSASIKKIGNKYIFADFGESQKGYNAISTYCNVKRVDFGTALHELAKDYGINGERPEAEKDFKKAGPEDKIGTTYIYNDEITTQELQILGKYVTVENCEAANLKSVKSYTVISKSGWKTTINSTPDYPIFVYDFGTWQKRYEPQAKDKNDRFRYTGGRPQDFIFGLEYVQQLQQEHANNVENEKESHKPSDLLLDYICITSGDRDGLNALSLDAPSVWLNSETATLTLDQFWEIKKLCKTVYLIPDLDATGVKQAIATGLENDLIKIAWLPTWLKHSRDFRGNALKDLRDYVSVNLSTRKDLVIKFKALLETAMPMRFWDEVYKPKTDTKKYIYNNEYSRHFLHHKGFFVYESEQSKEDFEFIRIEKNIVNKVKTHHIKKHLLNFLEVKQKPIDLRNMLLRTNQLTDKSLAQLQLVKPNFSKANFYSQLLFFKEKIWQVTPKGITEHKYGELENHVWKSDILEQNPELQNEHFTITKLDKGFDIVLHKTDNKYLNYLINTSRIFWREELEDPFKTDKGFNLVEKNKYFKENQFKIDGPNLSPKQIHEQKQHLVNKIFTIGYMQHSHKFKSKSWAVWNMDYKIVDDLESNGGTGKSLFFEMMFPILKNVKKIEGRQKGLADKDFLFDGVTDKTDIIFIDDADAYFRFSRLFTAITGDLQVNPKGTSAYEIKHEMSPKIAVSSNFGLLEADGSTKRRILFTLTSDYYHDKTDDYNEARQVSDDFGGKQLITNFTDEDWNDYFNFTAQCITFSLKQTHKINPPLENVEKRNLVREMKTPFLKWADLYFSETSGMLNVEFDKKAAYEDFKDKESQPNLSSSRFKKQLTSWCKYYGYTLNPKDYAGVKDGRIIGTYNGKTTEYFYISAPSVWTPEKPEATTTAKAIKTLPDNEKNDDLPF